MDCMGCMTRGDGRQEKPFKESLISPSSEVKIGFNLTTLRVLTSSRSRGLEGRGAVLWHLQVGQCGTIDNCTIFRRFARHRLLAGSLLVVSHLWIFRPVELKHSQCGIIKWIVASSNRNLSSSRAILVEYQSRCSHAWLQFSDVGSVFGGQCHPGCSDQCVVHQSSFLR